MCNQYFLLFQVNCFNAILLHFKFIWFTVLVFQILFFQLDTFKLFQKHDLFPFPELAFCDPDIVSVLEVKVFQFPFAFHTAKPAILSFYAFNFLLSVFLFFLFLQSISFFPPILHLFKLALIVSLKWSAVALTSISHLTFFDTQEISFLAPFGAFHPLFS
jgi:hypothetical protein